MGPTFTVATGHGIVTYERHDHAWRVRARGLDGQNVTSAIAREGVILAGTTNGVLRSDDGGQTWRLAEGSDGNPDLRGPPEPLIYADVHSIAVHPSEPDLVFAPTGGGLYRTRDGGKAWTLLYDCYVRAVWLDGDDANHLMLGPADGVDAHGRIEESHDGGQTWQVTSDGSQVPWRHHMAGTL